MKKLLSLLILSFFIISCSEKEPVVDETPSEIVDPNGDDNSGGNSDDGGAGWNGDVFSFAEIDVKSQWTFDGNQSSQGLQRITSLIEEIQINQALIDYEDSLDVGVLSIESPKTGELTSSETISVIVGNYGYLSILDSLEILGMLLAMISLHDFSDLFNQLYGLDFMGGKMASTVDGWTWDGLSSVTLSYVSVLVVLIQLFISLAVYHFLYALASALVNWVKAPYLPFKKL